MLNLSLNSNEFNILKQIVNSDGITRSEIARELSLNKATVSYVTSKFEDEGLIIKSDDLAKTKGRYGVKLRINADYGDILVLKIKVNSISVTVCKFNAAIVHEERIDKGKEDLYTVVNLIIDKLKSEYNIIALGIGIFGIVYDNNVKFTPYYKLDNNLYNKLTNVHNFPIFIENEANMEAYGDSKMKDNSNSLILTNSIGIGGGIVIKNSVYKGENGFAGEIGHMIVEKDGLPCPCGNKGCLEQYCSETALTKLASDVKGREINKTEFISLYAAADKDIVKIYHDSILYLTIAINNLLTTLNPASILLDGKIYREISDTVRIIENNLNSSIIGPHKIGVLPEKIDNFAYGFAKYISRYILLEK